MRSIWRSVVLGATILGTAASASAQLPRDPNPALEARVVYGGRILPGGQYDPDVPTPESILGFPQGARAATHAQIVECMTALAQWSNRVELVQMGETFEGRETIAVVISSPENIRRLDAIKANLARLADPRDEPESEIDALVDRLPAVAWFGCSIHGDETSPADGAVATAYHLAACLDRDVTDMLNDLVVVIDPMMNPDGRDRYLKQVAENRSAAPSVDSQSLLHTGYWPWGRTNHYGFDLNRDWILGVNPETRARLRALREWRPLIFIDAHEMGPLDTYLFSPSREPVNVFLPAKRLQWWDVFARDQAQAFDRFGWTYYTGEWNEEWYPGYSSSWAGYRGAVGILYEQAGWTEDAVRMPNGQLNTYAEAVHHNVVSMLANCRSLQQNKAVMMREFLRERRGNVTGRGETPQMSWAIVPGANRSRLLNFLELMDLEGIEVNAASRAFTIGKGRDRLGRAADGKELPAGTLLIGTRQPDAPLVAAMLAFDPQMSGAFLTDERRELLRTGESKLYDITAWNTTMLHDLEAYELDSGLPGVAEPLDPERFAPTSVGVDRPDARVAYLIDGADDDSLAAAGRLMQTGVRVRAAEREFTWSGRVFPRGTIVVARDDNRDLDGELVRRVSEVCADLSLLAVGADSGLGEGNENPDLGGGHFKLLERPRIAVLGRGQFSPYSYGATWFTIDQRLGIEASYLDSSFASFGDLRPFNVIVAPDAFGGSSIGGMSESLRAWVEAGGTLITIGSSSEAIANEDAKLTGARLLPETLGDLDEYELAVLREWAATVETVDVESVWSHDPTASSSAYPWEDASPAGDEDDEDAEAPSLERPDEETLKRQDGWDRLFMPQGAILAGRTDPKHWMTCGLAGYVPVVYQVGNPLMAGDGVEAPVRMGYLSPAPDAPARRLGWSLLPAGADLTLRMSGLLWPEAASRIANSAFVTRERVGNGQVICFATQPNFRGATRGTERILSNAMILGPGMGASAPVVP
ncbi:MAG: peptidase [Phycisphaeraceae bacterium]|nr:peptidase [Phycisphaeraceae bacterium]